MCDEIGNDEWLVRAVRERELDQGSRELTSFAFNSAELSVSRLSADAIQILLNRGPFACLCAINVGFCRSIGLEVVPDPNPDDPHHVLVLMATGRGSRATKLKRHAVRVDIGSDPGPLYAQLLNAIERWTPEPPR